MKKSFNIELKKVWKVAKKEFIYKTFTSLVVRGLLLIIPILFSMSVSKITSGDLKSAIILTIISILITTLYRLFEVINQYSFYKLYNKIFAYYSDIAINETDQNSIFSLSRFSLGQFSNIVISDVDIISGFFANGVIRVVQVIEFAFIYYYFYTLNVYIFGSAVLLTIILIMISFKSGNKVQNLNEKRKSELDEFTASTNNYFAGIKEIKSFNLFNFLNPIQQKNTNNYLKANADYNIKYQTKNQVYLYFFELFRLLTIIYALYLVSTGSLDVGIIIVIYNYYQKIIDNFLVVLTINFETRNLKVSLNRFNKLLEYSSSKNQIESININNIEGKISVKNILYGYKKNPMLNNVSFTIEPNTLTAITGKDVVAQNAVFDLLLRLNRQHEGDIFIDNVNIKDINDDDYFSLISCARKESIFFNYSIKDNLMMVERDFKKIKDLCISLGVDDDIMSLEDGYDTIITENTPLKKSSRDLLIIIRLLLKNSKILLIDRSINLLDDKTLKKLYDIVNELKKNHTIVVFSRDKDILSKVDHIIEVDVNKAKIVK